MCEVCKMMLLEDHEIKDDPELKKCRCKVFRKQPGARECYHCFNRHGGKQLEPCPICDKETGKPI